MEHRPYPKIPSRPDPSQSSPAGIWVATEKVHGAQVVVGCDGSETHIGKRKAWLADGEPFFGWQLLRAELAAAARGVHAALASPRAVRLYGELFGGAYPHPAVPPSPGISAVQTGIWYSPNLHFALFDVVVETAADDAAEFLAHSEVERLAAAHGLLVVPLVGRGPRSVVDALPIRAPTRVPAWFGLPPIEGNVAEGLVLKPDVRAAPSDRFVIKRKIVEFDDARFDEATPFEADVVLGVGELASHAARLVNDARVASARSKVGTALAAVLDEMVLDVLVDLEAAFPAALRALTPDQEAQLRDEIERLATEMSGLLPGR
ncbi:MAG: RNA ligase [Myxococcales bacterium]|nr:RNA ligase [Myxococcales bacterium]